MILGFIGLGAMGAPIASNLIKAGYTVYVYNRTQAKAENVLKSGQTGVLAHSLSDFAACDIVFTCLARPENVCEIMLAPGVYSFLKQTLNQGRLWQYSRKSH